MRCPLPAASSPLRSLRLSVCAAPSAGKGGTTADIVGVGTPRFTRTPRPHRPHPSSFAPPLAPLPRHPATAARTPRHTRLSRDLQFRRLVFFLLFVSVKRPPQQHVPPGPHGLHRHGQERRDHHADGPRRAGHGRRRGRGALEHKHSTVVESPPPPLPVCSAFTLKLRQARYWFECNLCSMTLPRGGAPAVRTRRCRCCPRGRAWHISPSHAACRVERLGHPLK